MPQQDFKQTDKVSEAKSEENIIPINKELDVATETPKQEIEERALQEQQKVPVSECETKKSFTEKNDCYILEAQNKKDPSICNKIGKDLAIKDCLLKVTTFLGSAELCKKLSDEIDKKACLFTVGYGKDLEFCNSLPDNDVGTKIEKGNCFTAYYGSIMNEQFEKLDKSVCDYWGFEGKDGCLEKLAKLKEDYTYCPSLQCVISIAKSKKDPSLCDEAKKLIESNVIVTSTPFNIASYDEEIVKCKDDIAIDGLNPDGCETPRCISDIAIELGDMTICFKGCKVWSYSNYKYFAINNLTSSLLNCLCFERLITGDEFVGSDSQGNSLGYDRKFTVDDCNKMKDSKCSDCKFWLYDACLIRALIREPNLKEDECNLISDENLKKKCIYESYER